jgi:hypothetical protein
MAHKDDWRLMGQQRYLRSATLRWKTYYRWSEDWDHDHCEFCGTKFLPPDNPYQEPDVLHAGYATAAHGEFPDDYHWICAKCYADFKDMFDWKVVG